ncbi:hypothetical protein D3C85_1095340 [compost metagenome]
MTAEADGVPDPVVILADLCHLVAAIAHQPAPGILDLHVFQLGVDRHQVGLEQAGDGLRAAIEHGNASAPENPAVLQRPVVVEGEAGVVDRRLAVDGIFQS